MHVEFSKADKAFTNGMFNAVTEDNIEGLEFNWNIVFNICSDPQNQKPQIINELLHRAAQHGSLSATKILLERHHADINYLDRHLNTPLYVAAVGNHVSVVKHILETQEEKLDLHKASGVFANGPTALWIATEKGNTDVVRLLLHHGGPVEEKLAYIQLEMLTGTEERQLEVVANSGYRASVALRLIGDGEAMERNQAVGQKSLVLGVTTVDLDWLRKVEVRKSDVELGGDERGRPLRTQ